MADHRDCDPERRDAVYAIDQRRPVGHGDTEPEAQLCRRPTVPGPEDGGEVVQSDGFFRARSDDLRQCGTEYPARAEAGEHRLWADEEYYHRRTAVSTVPRGGLQFHQH